jgi:hypothetical protein
MKTLTRACFVKSVFSTLGCAVLLASCGDDDDDMGAGGTGGNGNVTGGNGGGGHCTSGSVDAEIGPNHGHTLTVPLADVTAGQTKSYMLTTGNGHTHMVEVTAERFGTLKASGTVTGLVSVADSTGHTHTVALTCTG